MPAEASSPTFASFCDTGLKYGDCYRFAAAANLHLDLSAIDGSDDPTTQSTRENDNSDKSSSPNPNDSPPNACSVQDIADLSANVPVVILQKMFDARFTLLKVSNVTNEDLDSKVAGAKGWLRRLKHHPDVIVVKHGERKHYADTALAEARKDFGENAEILQPPSLSEEVGRVLRRKPSTCCLTLLENLSSEEDRVDYLKTCIKYIGGKRKYRVYGNLEENNGGKYCSEGQAKNLLQAGLSGTRAAKIAIKAFSVYKEKAPRYTGNAYCPFLRHEGLEEDNEREEEEKEGKYNVAVDCRFNFSASKIPVERSTEYIEQVGALLSNEKQRAHFVSLMALKVQQPHKALGVAIVLEGVGAAGIVDVLRSLLGEYHVREVHAVKDLKDLKDLPRLHHHVRDRVKRKRSAVRRQERCRIRSWRR